MSESADHLTTGFLLNGRYIVERELGRGGVGIVYLARDDQLHSRPVVVKVLLEESYRDEWIKTKFRQEMEALSRLDHPGIVNLLDTGELPEGRPFLVMQYVEGVLLRSLMRPEGMDMERVALLSRQIGDALTAAHDRGVLHRDLKPENIMIQSPGRGEQAKIIDFGLAKVFNSRVAESTSIPNVAGSFSYMAPEQLMARPVSAASDTYSFGVIVYEMLTGRRPHNPDSMFQLLDMLRAGVRVRPRDLRPSLPETADSVILKALSFEPADRQEQAAEFGQQIEHALLHADASSPQTVETARIADQPAHPAWLRKAAAWLSVVLLFTGVLFLARASFFRFQGWPRFLSQPQVFLPSALCLTAAILAPLPGLFSGRRVFLLDRVFNGYGPARIAAVLAAAFLAAAAGARNPGRVIVGALLQGRPEVAACCVLRYSDPRGYRYTLQDTSYYRIRIQPDRFNKLSDYELRVTLPPELEFSDIYLDRGFHVQDPLALEPSATNDVLVLRQSGDSLQSASRDLVFTTKYRSTPASTRIQVRLQTPGDSISYAF